MREIIHTILFVLVGQLCLAQGGDNSPFSRFGLGDVVNENFMSLRSMGNLGSSYANVYNINIVNPASLASLRATAFDIGLYAKYSNLSDDAGNSSSQWSGNLEYISLAFPLANPINDLFEREERDIHLAMAFTLMPNTQVSYDISSDQFVAGLDTISRNFSGNGGTYKFYWGNAINYKNYSLGLNLGYAFGNIEYERNVLFNNLSFPFNTAYSNNYSISGFIWKLGAQYTAILNKKDLDDKSNVAIKKIVFGLHGNSNSSISTNSDFFDRTVQVTGPLASDILIDTIAIGFGQEGTGRLPGTIGFGASYYNGTKSIMGFDIQSTFWSKYRNDANPETLNNTYRISIGGQYRPNSKSFGNYFKRVNYRYGVYYQTDPREIDNKALTNYGVTLGMGLPFIYQRKISHANIGFNLGTRGQGTPLKETFARINFSFTFNDDEWFIKRKYD